MNSERPSVTNWSTMKSAQLRWLHRYMPFPLCSSWLPTLRTLNLKKAFIPSALHAQPIPIGTAAVATVPTHATVLAGAKRL